MDKKRLFTLTFVGLCLVLAAVVVYILTPFVKPILWGVIFTIIFMPPHTFLSRRLGSSTVSAFVITLAVLVLFVVPISVMGIVTLKEAIELTKGLIVKYKSVSFSHVQNKLLELPLVSYVIAHLPKGVVDPNQLAKLFVSTLKEVANFSASQLKSFFLSIGITAVQLFIFLFTFFFLLKDAQSFRGYIYKYIPLEEEDKSYIISSIYTTTLSVVYGTVGTALVQGTVGLLLYLVMGVPYPFLWAMVTAYASFIPPLGASMVWFPVSVYLFFKVGWVKGVLAAVLGFTCISSMDNIVKPLIMKNRVHVPYIVLFFAIFGGLLKFGFIGMFLGPILFNLLFSLMKIYETKFLS